MSMFNYVAREMNWADYDNDWSYDLAKFKILDDIKYTADQINAGWIEVTEEDLTTLLTKQHEA